MRTVYIMYIIHCKLGVSFKSVKIIYTAGYIPVRSRAHVCECLDACTRLCARACVCARVRLLRPCVRACCMWAWCMCVCLTHDGAPTHVRSCRASSSSLAHPAAKLPRGEKERLFDLCAFSLRFT